MRSRVLPLLIVLAALLAPALVATSADAAPAKYRVGIKLSDTNVQQGDTVLVTGKVRPLRTGKVLLQRRTNGRWKTLRKVKLVASTYAASVRVNDVGVTFLRVVVPASKGVKKGTTKTKTVRVLANGSNPQIATASLPGAALGVAYSAQVKTADDRAGTWSIGAGALPPGLTINATTGVISGTPTTAGTSEFGVYFRDTDRRVAAKIFTVTVSDGVIITTTLPDAVVATPYTAELKTAGNRTGTWSLTAGTLPAGLTLAPSGVISGTPTTVGPATRFTVQFKETSTGKTSTQDLTITVKTAAAPEIGTLALASGVKDTPYSQTLRVKDNRPGVWDVTAGSLPPGLTLSGTTGVISGTPVTVGTFPFTIRFRDAQGATDTQELAIAITDAGPPVITTTTLPDGKVNQAYSAQLTTAGNQPGTWTVAAGTLPAGLTLNPTTGAITGTPTAKGTSTFTVRFTNASGVATTKQFSIKVQSCFLIFCS